MLVDSFASLFGQIVVLIFVGHWTDGQYCDWIGIGRFRQASIVGPWVPVLDRQIPSPYQSKVESLRWRWLLQLRKYSRAPCIPEVQERQQRRRYLHCSNR